MPIKINAADAVEDPAIKNVIAHLHVALANSKEVQTVVLLSALSNLIGMIAAGTGLDIELVLNAVRADYAAQGLFLADRLERLRTAD